MNEKEPQELPEYTSEHIKSLIFHNPYGLPWALPIFSAALPVHAIFKIYVCFWSFIAI